MAVYLDGLLEVILLEVVRLELEGGEAILLLSLLKPKGFCWLDALLAANSNHK